MNKLFFENKIEVDFISISVIKIFHIKLVSENDKIL